VVAQFVGFSAVGVLGAAILIGSAACFVLIGTMRVPALQKGAT